MADQFSASQIARFDQAHACRTRQLDVYVGTMRDTLDICPQECTVVEMANYLANEVSHPECAELLACALERLANSPIRVTPGAPPPHP